MEAVYVIAIEAKETYSVIQLVHRYSIMVRAREHVQTARHHTIIYGQTLTGESLLYCLKLLCRL